MSILSVERVKDIERSGLGAEWKRFLAVVPTWRNRRSGEYAIAVVSNMFTLASGRRAEDYEQLETLTRRYGKHRMALTQHEMSSVIETTGDEVLGSLFVHGLAPPFYGPVLAASFDQARAGELADVCTRAAMLFMLAGAHEVDPGPDIETPAAFLDHFLNEHLPQWRAQIVRYAENPWSSYARHLEHLADEAGMVEFGPTIRRFVRAMRQHLDDRDRETVADEIKRLVAATGLSQREFAKRFGTSPSRLSSYCTNQTTPSAATFLRIRRFSAELVRSGRAKGSNSTPATR